MKRLLIVLPFILVSSVCGQALQVGKTGITFTPPAGFKKVPQDIIDIKWPGKRAPAFVVGNEGATTTVAYDLKPHAMPQNKLGEALQQFKTMFSQVIPGCDWKKHELIEHSGQKWVYLELSSTAVDTDIYNMMMMTGFKGKMLIFNFNSTKKDFPKYEKALRASIKSIKLP